MAEFDVDAVLTQSLELAVKFHIEELDVRRSGRRQQIPERFKSFFLTSSVGHTSITSIDDLKVLIQQTIARFQYELSRRFDNDHFDLMRAADACLPSSVHFMDGTQLGVASKQFGVEIRQCELDVFKGYIHSQKKSVHSFNGLLEVMDNCDKNIFPSIYKMLQILITLPQTSCTVERMFSTVKRVKTRLRSKMSTERLSNLTLLSMEKELTKSLDRNRVLDVFRSMKHRRLIF